MSERSIVVITAGLGQPSSTRLLGDRLGAATERALSASGVSSAVRVVELREHARDLTNQLLTGVPSAALAELITQVIEADALIVVTPIFSASYSGLFKMFFDVLQPDSLAGLPVLIAATAGTARHSLVLDHAMRPLFTYLRTVVVPTGGLRRHRRLVLRRRSPGPDRACRRGARRLGRARWVGRAPPLDRARRRGRGHPVRSAAGSVTSWHPWI